MRLEDLGVAAANTASHAVGAHHQIGVAEAVRREVAVVAQLAADGFPAFIRSRADGTSHQVIVGPYVSAEEAAAAQKSMASQGVSGTEVRIETTNLSEPAWR
jgi:cell division protein FtsN